MSHTRMSHPHGVLTNGVATMLLARLRVAEMNNPGVANPRKTESPMPFYFDPIQVC